MVPVFHPWADQDVVEQATHYRGIDTRLADRFLLEMDRVLTRIVQDPYLCHNHGDGILSVRLRTFPFSIFYAVDDQRLVVLAVCHERRNPRVWQDRR